jgi:hypothetical protein
MKRALLSSSCLMKMGMPPRVSLICESMFDLDGIAEKRMTSVRQEVMK